MIKFRLPWAKAAEPPTGSVSLPEILIRAGKVPKYNSWDISTAIQFGYKANAAFFACADVRSSEISSVPWVAKFNGEAMPDSDLQRLIDYPNPDISWQEMIEHLVNSLDLAGNEYWSIVTGGLSGTKPLEVWPLDPRGMAVKQTNTQRIIGEYVYNPPGAGKGRTLPAAQVVHIKNANPDSFVIGLPTIMAAGIGVDIYREARDAQKSSFENRGISDYAVVLDPSTTAEQFERIKEIDAERSAGPKNNRKPRYTTRDIKTLSSSPVDMDYVNSVQSVIDEICSVMRVPPSMIGYMQDATLANFETARKVLWINGLLPVIRRIQAQLQLQLASKYGKGWTIEPDLSKVDALKANYAQAVETGGKLWAMGVPFNMINTRLELGFDEIEGGEVGYLAGGLIPANVDWSGGTMPEPTADEVAKAMQLLSYGAK